MRSSQRSASSSIPTAEQSCPGVQYPHWNASRSTNASWSGWSSPSTVDEHGARTALSVVAALLRAGEPEVLAQQVEQRGARVDRQRVLGAVDPERDGMDLHAGKLLP